MAAVLVQVADAVVELLNTVDTFSQSFTAERKYPHSLTPLEKIRGRRVDVVPSSHFDTELGTRGTVTYVVRVVIVIRERFTQDDRQEETSEGRPISNEAVDELVALVEEINEFFCGDTERTQTNSDNLKMDWQETKILSTYDHEQLKTGLFDGRIQVDYRASVEI
jgi:hypothetical protein